MKKIKMRFLSVILVLVLGICCFAACGKKESGNSDTTKENTTEETTAEQGNNQSGNETKELKDMNAIELTEVMGNGINLGNTMEAYGRKQFGITSATSTYETFWGMPVTTKEMIQGMKDAGFDSIRIPVAWTNMMDFENGDYKIDQKYLDRVGEIIGWAIDADLIVVVNDHWDGGWWGRFGSATEATRKAAMEQYVSMWEQIADAYKDYDYHLIFESANEELGGRLNDNDATWNADSGSLSEDECYETVNKINQKFVDVIRGADGDYNKDRFLLIAGYDTDIAKSCDDRYVMPTDTAKDRLIVSVHFYDPSGYCIFASNDTWGTKAEVEAVNTKLAKMTKFTDAGYGVIIGEWGVLENNGEELRSNTMDYYTNFIANCDYYGYCPILWDCNDIFHREEATMRYDEVGKFFEKHAYSSVESLKTTQEIKDAAKRLMDSTLENAPDGEIVPDTEARAWIMYTSSDWGKQYRVGDDYPEGQTEGIVATDVTVTGEGSYTVALDFTAAGGGNGFIFSAVGILNGEKLFPGYFIEIKEIRIDGEAVELIAKPYTTTDDGNCTRVNIYNDWVKSVPEEARVSDGDLTECGSNIIDITKYTQFNSIEVDFEYVAP